MVNLHHFNFSIASLFCAFFLFLAVRVAEIPPTKRVLAAISEESGRFANVGLERLGIVVGSLFAGLTGYGVFRFFLGSDENGPAFVKEKIL